MTQIVKNLNNIVENYQVLLIDLWGVVHDGNALKPGILQFLENCQKNNKKVIFFSNAPRRVENVAQKIDSLKIPKNFYDTIITSGEVARAHFAKQAPKKYLFWGMDKDLDLLNDLPHEMTENCHEADFILNLGYENFAKAKNNEFPATYDLAKSLNLPMICCNPDITVELKPLNGQREDIFCAGKIAEEYGGDVKYFGKPHAEMYEFAVKQANIAQTAKIIAIGDSLYTDILGANKFKIDSILVTNGIFKHKIMENGEISEKALREQIEIHKAVPNYAIKDVFW